MSWPPPAPLTPGQIDALRQPTYVQLQKLGMPSLAELDKGIDLLMKEHPVDARVLRRRLKWLIKTMRKRYGVDWTTPWDQHK